MYSRAVVVQDPLGTLETALHAAGREFSRLLPELRCRHYYLFRQARNELAPRLAPRRLPTLLAIKRGEMPWDDAEAWRQSLHSEFDKTLTVTKLPDRPDYARANALLGRARRLALSEELP